MSIATIDPRPVERSAALLEDRFVESAILNHLLDEHPRPMTVAELAEQMRGGYHHDTVARVVGNLTEACLLDRHGDRITPARAVVAFDRPATPASRR